MTWADWIFAESRRRSASSISRVRKGVLIWSRTSFVWFLATRTISVKTLDDCPTSEQPQNLPLPAPKLQWEARTYEAWIEEMQAISPTMCLYGDLIESKRRCEESFYAKRLDAWNARTDNLGALLNLAVTMV